MADTNAEQIKNSAISLDVFYGKKEGMTRIFDKNGNHIPVTVVKLLPNYVSQVKTQEKDSYNAYQVAFDDRATSKNISKGILGHLKKNNLEGKNLKKFFEIRESKDATLDESAVGQSVNQAAFLEGVFVDVTGVSKGKGFQGVMKKYNFRGGPAAHGSHFHRAPGSIGNRATPSRVFAEKKMPGQMGNKKCTVQNIKVVELSTEEGYILLKGSVPGGKNGFIRIQKSVKKA